MAAVDAAVSDLGMLARRWPADWYSRYERPVARILAQPRVTGVANAPYAAQAYAQPHPVRWPRLVGQALPAVPPVPLARTTIVMGAPVQAEPD